jgi:GNAT superfamily N-acetyltransferase
MANQSTEPPMQIAAMTQDGLSPAPAQLLEEYEAGRGLLRGTVSGMTREDLLARPVPGRWSTLEVVCHISDTEQFFADRMKRTLAMNRPLLMGADGWLYPEAVRYHDRDLVEELALVDLTRRQMVRILKLVPSEAWGRTAVHSETGLMTLRQLLRHAIGHLKHHLAFIEEKRQALAAAAPSSPQSPPTTVAGEPHEVARQGDFFISTDPGLLDVPLLHDFLSKCSYWATGVPLDVVRRSLDNSLCFGLYKQGRQVGFARVVSDRATFAWLCDVFVLEAYRGGGLSKWMMQCVMGHPALQGLRRFMLGTRDAHGLYERYGFKPLEYPARFLEVFRSDVYRGDQPADREGQR